MKLRKVHSAFIAAVLTCSLAVTPVFAEPTQEELEGQKAEAQSELSSLQSQLDTLISKANDLEVQLINKGQEITQAQEDLAAAEEKKEQQYEAMKLRIKYMYEAGSGTATMEKVMSSGNISDMLTQAEYSQKVHEYDRAQLQEYANTVTEIENLQTTLEAEMANLQDLEKQYETQQAELSQTISSKQDEITNLDEMIQEAARKAEEERKAAEEAARKAEEERQRQQQEQQNTNTGTTPDNGGTADTPSNGGSTGGSGGGSTSSEPDYSVSTGNAIVDRAYSWVGRAEYVWGACSPGAFDCSGFVSYCLTGAYSRLGTTYTFLGWPQVSNPQPGDVCVNAQHCGIYIGGGQMIHAATYGVGVIVGPVQSGMIYVRY